jgi:hypothetical protein
LHRIKKGTNVPTFVLEFLLARYCASNEPAEIQAGMEAVLATLDENYVRPDVWDLDPFTNTRQLRDRPRHPFARPGPNAGQAQSPAALRGDVFAAVFLVRYHETGDLAAAGAFAACAASCVIEAPGTQGLGDRGEVERRLVLRQRLLDDGEWDE